MSNVLPFATRANGGEWTDAERARLSELADKLSGSAGKVTIVCGVSDKGDPWCAITDENQDVLIHVAKIDGQFVIHDAAADTLRVGDSLSSACDRLLGPEWRNPREDVVVSLSQRQVQSVLAIAVLANFVHEVAEVRADAPDVAAGSAAETATASVVFIAAAVSAIPYEAKADMETSDLVDAPSGAAYAPTEDAGQAAAPIRDAEHVLLADDEDGPAEPPAEAEQAATDAAIRAEIQGVRKGGDGDDVLVGGEGANELFGGAGDDTAVGGGQNDLVIGGDDDDLLLGLEGHDIIYGNAGDDTGDGGDGDDWVRGGRGDDSLSGGEGDDFLSGDKGFDTISGGRGADTFNIFGGGGLDRVTDFTVGEGDRVRIEGGGQVVVRQEGDDTVIRLGEDDAVVLVNVQMSTLTSGWLVT